MQTDLSSPYRMKEMLQRGETYNWPDLVTRDGSQQNHFIAVSGGSEKVNYHFGVGYNKEKGMYENDDQERINFKGSVDARINKVISAGFSINGARTENSYADNSAIQQAWRMNPYMIPYDEEGNIINQPGNRYALDTDGFQFSDQISPLNMLKNSKQEKETWRMLGNFYIQLDLFKGFNIKSTFSPSYTSYRTGSFSGYTNPATGLTYGNENPEDEGVVSGSYLTSKSFGWTWDNMVNYSTTIAEDHNLSFMGLISLESGQSEAGYLKASNPVPETADWWNLKSGTVLADSYTSYSESSMLSYALRANYNWKNRYLLTGTIRWDGSSKFQKDYRWGSFPSVAAAWRITEEPFMKDIDWISNLKLRLSYGVTGNNAGIGNYDTQQIATGPVYYPFGSTYYSGYYPSGVVNATLQWEKSHEVNLGLDFGFLRGRISGSIDVYQKKSTDLLFDVPLPLESGGGTMTTNVGSVRNRGIELSVTTVNIENKDWYWSTTFNFAHNQNRVMELMNDAQMILNGETGSIFVDEPVQNVYGYQWGGIVSDKDFVVPDHEVATTNGFTPGETVKMYDYYYKCYGLTEGQPYIVDVNGDGNFDDSDKKIWSRDPSWTGSLSSNLQWKNWDFSFNIYTKQNYTVKSNFIGSYLDLSDRGRERIMQDWYIPAGTLLDADGVNADGTYINPVFQQTTHYGAYPFPNYGGSNSGVGRQADYWNQAKCYVDASYVKVKNITLGYTFPKKLINSFGCNQLRLYFTVTNPFVFSDYDGFDAEWADAATKNDGPSTITYQIGASIKF